MDFYEFTTRSELETQLRSLPAQMRQTLMDVLTRVMLDPSAHEGETLDLRVQYDCANGQVQITFPVPLQALTLPKADALSLCEVIRGACDRLPDYGASPGVH